MLTTPSGVFRLFYFFIIAMNFHASQAMWWEEFGALSLPTRTALATLAESFEFLDSLPWGCSSLDAKNSWRLWFVA